MAILDSTRTSAGAGFSGLFGNLVGIFSAWNDARVTRKSLSRLSARELDDIGLNAGDIDLIATRGPRA